jgi:hypothetical protein
MSRSQTIYDVLSKRLPKHFVVEQIGEAVAIYDENVLPVSEVIVYTSSLIGPEFGYTPRSIQALETLDLVSKTLARANIVKLGDDTISFNTWA